MAIDAQCPHCRKLLRAPDKKAGQQVNCPHCQQPIIVPEKPVTAGALQVVGQQPAERAIVGVTQNASVSAATSPSRTTPADGGWAVPSDTSKSNGAPVTGGAQRATAGDTSLPRAAAVPRAADATWYMRTPDDQQYGPVKRQELDEWVSEGRVDLECQILCEGWEQWKWASDVYPQLSASAVEQIEFPTIVGEPTASSYAQFDSAPFPSLSKAAATSSIVTSVVGAPAGSGMPPPLPSSTTTTVTQGETDFLSGPGARFANSQRAWIVTDLGLAISNGALWIALGGVVCHFGLYVLSQTIERPHSINTIGNLIVWATYAEAAALIVLAASWCVCHSTPQEAGARGWTQAAVGVLALGLGLTLFVSVTASLWDTEAARTIAQHLPAVLVTLGLAALAFFALFLGKLGNFFGDARLSQQGMICAGFQAVILAWSLVAIYALGTGTDSTANIMRSAVTAAVVGGDAVWLEILTRRARLPLKSM